jgi:electron transfer flavoprotein alpha subunit
MAKVLLIAEHDGTSLNPSTAKCVACAAEISGAEIEVAVFAESAGAIAAQAASLDSVSRVLSNEATANRGALAAVLAPQIVAMADSYDYIFGPSTTFGKDLMPRVAALLGVNQISDIMSVEGERVFKRPIYAGSAVVTVEAPAGVPWTFLPISRITHASSRAKPASLTGLTCNRRRASWPVAAPSAARKIST